LEKVHRIACSNPRLLTTPTDVSPYRQFGSSSFRTVRKHRVGGSRLIHQR
jgi:hypothetical protein